MSDDTRADALDDAIWDMNIPDLGQYDVARIVRVAVLPWADREQAQLRAEREEVRADLRHEQALHVQSLQDAARAERNHEADLAALEQQLAAVRELADSIEQEIAPFQQPPVHPADVTVVDRIRAALSSVSDPDTGKDG